MKDAVKKSEPIWTEDVAAQLLHILPQSTNHDDCTIVGAPEAIRRLGEALIMTADGGKARIVKNLMARDGEGYHINIQLRDQWAMEEVPMPYAQMGQPWDFDRRPDPVMSIPDIQKCLDRYILQVMEDHRDPSYSREEYAFHLRIFVSDPWITKDMARAVCRSLTDRGYAFYMRGLMTEDGDMGGAGYGITEQGAAYLKTLME